MTLNNNINLYTLLLGLPRMKMLVILFQDRRYQQFSFYSILKKMFLCHIIRPNDVRMLDSMLHSYQRKKTVDGSYLAFCIKPIYIMYLHFKFCYRFVNFGTSYR